MASMVFTRGSDGKQLRFDSSPQFSLPKAFAWVEGSVELRRTATERDTVTFDVYAKLTPDDSKLSKMGVLVQKTREAIWRGYK